MCGLGGAVSLTSLQLTVSAMVSWSKDNTGSWRTSKTSASRIGGEEISLSRKLAIWSV